MINLFPVKKNLEKNLENELQETFHYIFGVLGSNDGIWDWDLKRNKIFLSSRWNEILGYEPQDIEADPQKLFQHIHPNDISLLKFTIENHIADKTDSIQCEYRIIRKDQKICWILMRGKVFLDNEGRAIRLSGTLSDLTHHKMKEEHLIQNAFFDSVTGLPNRSLFLDRLKQSLIGRYHYDQEKIGIFFLDLDHFKIINDRFGHSMGDKVLKEIAQRLLQICRQEDTITRYGGDEFVILVNQVSVLEAETLAQRIIDNFKSPLTIENYDISVTVSLGIVLERYLTANAETLLENGDFALYQAKTSGRNQYKIFDEKMSIILNNQDQLKSSLGNAINQHQIIMFYQPIIDLKTGDIVGFEALMRWNHPTYGVILPKTFIPIAENYDLMVWLGEFGLTEACQHLKIFNERFAKNKDWFVSVNFSNHQFRAPNTCQIIESLLDRIGLLPSLLKLELTESILANPQEDTFKILSKLQKNGVGIVLDNFGHDVTSLKLLLSYSFDMLKIDRSLTSLISYDQEKSEKILGSIRNLTKSLSLKTVIEGIETEKMHESVKKLDFSYGQGFLYCEPLSKNDLLVYLENKFK